MPHMKPEEAQKVSSRWGKRMQQPEERKSAGEELFDAFRQTGMRIVEEPRK